jgi:YegS/Rv2252/BmrU family lipid kinase
MTATDPAGWPTRWRFIVNPTAAGGRAGRTWQEIQKTLAGAGLVGESILTRGPRDAVRLAAEAGAAGAAVMAVGGDGTFLEVASGLLQSGSPTPLLGLIPVGTGNDFARSLGIANLDGAISAVLERKSRCIDAIRIECQGENGPRTRHALSFAAVGISGELLKRTTPTVKRLFGPRLAYYVGLLRALWHYRAPRFRLRWDDGQREGGCLFAGVSNTERAGGGMRLAPGAQPDDGRLNVNLIDALGRWETCRQLRLLASGRHVEHPRVDYFPATELTIEADPPVEIAADGERVGWTPATFRVVPETLRVVAPPANQPKR